MCFCCAQLHLYTIERLVFYYDQHVKFFKFLCEATNSAYKKDTMQYKYQWIGSLRYNWPMVGQYDKVIYRLLHVVLTYLSIVHYQNGDRYHCFWPTYLYIDVRKYPIPHLFSRDFLSPFSLYFSLLWRE